MKSKCRVFNKVTKHKIDELIDSEQIRFIICGKKNAVRCKNEGCINYEV